METPKYNYKFVHEIVHLMKIKLLFIFLIFSYFECQSQKTIDNNNSTTKLILNEKLIIELSEMLKNDQLYRSSLSESYIDTSLIKEISKLPPQDQLELITKSLNQNKKNNLSHIQKDSLWKLQHNIDKDNTKRLIQIVKKYGYINSENSNSKIPLYPMFMHTPEEYKNEVLKIIESENSHGNINLRDYKSIKWHLTGRSRKSLPLGVEYIKNNDSID